MGIFGGGIIGVMNQQVGAAGKSRILGNFLAARVYKAELIIREKNESFSALLEFVAQPVIRVAEFYRRHADAAHFTAPGTNRSELEPGRDLLELYREAGRLHGFGYYFSDGIRRKRTAHYLYMGLLTVDRRKKRETQHMVPMRVREQHAEIILGILQELFAQKPDAGAGVDYNKVFLFGADFQAGSTAPVLQVILP